MKTFSIDITRISYGYKTFEVEANTLEEAEELALELALDEVFEDDDADYKVEDSIEIKN